MTNHDAEHPDTKHPYDVEPGDEVHPGDPIVVDRYTGGARINHWINATLLVLLAISGLALFHPSLFFLSALFGGGQNTRAIHPWIGVIFLFTFLGLFVRFWRANLWKPEDGSWMRRLYDVLTNHEEKIPEVGKYNAGQKVVFWMMALLIIVLIGSGLLMWDQYFSQFTTPGVKRIAVFVHSVAAITIISVWIVHVYAAIWVRGSIPAMVQGSVTGGWAWKHHRKWLKELVTGKSAHDRAGHAPAE